MSHSIEVVSELSRKISVTVPAEDVNAALNAAAREVGASLTVPGFRKGKAPVSVIEKRLPEEVTGFPRSPTFSSASWNPLQTGF